MATNPSKKKNEKQASESSHTTLTASVVAAVAAVAAVASPGSVSTTRKAGTSNTLHGDGVPPLDTPSKTRKRTRPRPSEYDTDAEDEEDRMPTSMRKTTQGGYAHTKKSRARISKANAGKTPWNKGKQRSEADKARIGAAVRARNRAILLKKLESLNMTEEEWFKKKKEIRYLRERVRRAKKRAMEEEEKMSADVSDKVSDLQRQLDEALVVQSMVDGMVRNQPYSCGAQGSSRIESGPVHTCLSFVPRCGFHCDHPLTCSHKFLICALPTRLSTMNIGFTFGSPTKPKRRGNKRPKQKQNQRQERERIGTRPTPMP